MYSFIVNPKNNKKYKTTSKIGKNIINKYLKQIGGEYLGKGTYKCVFSPPLKCLGDKIRYKNSETTNYVSAVTTYEELQKQLKIEKMKKKIDPLNKFTLKLLKHCKVGELDDITEGIGQFSNCTNSYNGNFLQNYNHPFTGYTGDRTWDLRLMINDNGGSDLNKLLDDIQYKNVSELIILLPKLYITFLEVMKGVRQCVKNKVIHSDIKPGNILYDEKKNKYYIIDFGLMKTFSKIYKREIYMNYTINMKPGDVHYRYWPFDSGIAVSYSKNKQCLPKTPLISTGFKHKEEVIQLYKRYKTSTNNVTKFIKHSKEKFDVFSLGVTMLEYFFSSQTEAVLTKTLKSSPTNKKIIAINNISPQLRSLVNKMTNMDPVERPSINSVIKEYSKIIRGVKKAHKVNKKTLSGHLYIKKCSLNTLSKCEEQSNCVRREDSCVKNISPSPEHESAKIPIKKYQTPT